MALLFADGFERYTNGTQMATIWSMDNASGETFTTGRIQGSCLSLNTKPGGYGTSASNAWISPSTLGNATSGYVGFGLKVSSNNEPAAPFVLRDGYSANGSHLSIRIEGGVLKLCRNVTVIATGASFLANTWYYIEIYWNIHASTGSCIVRRNGAIEINYTGNTYAGTGNAYVNTIHLQSADGLSRQFDDLYIDNAAFLGNFRAVRLVPESAGDITQWTPNTGANYASVDETTTDSDTTYVSTSTDDNIDLYNMNSPTHGGSTILGVNSRYIVRREVSNTNFAPVYKTSGGTVQVGATIPITSGTYVVKDVLQTINPETGVAWTQGDIDGLQIGIKKLT